MGALGGVIGVNRKLSVKIIIKGRKAVRQKQSKRKHSVHATYTYETNLNTFTFKYFSEYEETFQNNNTNTKVIDLRLK